MTFVMTDVAGVDVVRPGDRPALHRLFEACSAGSIHARFFAAVRQLPVRYLDGLLAGPPRRHDAVVVRYGDGLHLAGVASLVAQPESPREAELGVLVADAWQGHGHGAAMVEQLLLRARERGVERLIATTLPQRAGLLTTLARRLGPGTLQAERDYLTGVFEIG